jgi:hypothetical protein
MAALIYIGGFGRSGSTLLEYFLTCDPKVVACGEVTRHARRVHTRRPCTCGRSAMDCPVWGPFQAQRKGVDPLDHRPLTLALLERVSSQYSAMVDSSKTAWGSTLIPFQLQKELGANFLLVHLVRDPRAVCWSTVRAMNEEEGSPHGSPLVRCLETAVGWITANLACEQFGRRHPERYLRLRYEDLIGTPRQAIKEILDRIPLQSGADLQCAGTGDNRHQLYGNAMRFRPVELSSLQEDTDWKSAMPKAYRAIAAITWPLAAKYGYFKNGT